MSESRSFRSRRIFDFVRRLHHASHNLRRDVDVVIVDVVDPRLLFRRLDDVRDAEVFVAHVDRQVAVNVSFSLLSPFYFPCNVRHVLAQVAWLEIRV